MTVQDPSTIGGTWQLRLAWAPWFGTCLGTCDRELGLPDKNELVATVPGSHGYFCIPCVTEIIRTAEIAFFGDAS